MFLGTQTPDHSGTVFSVLGIPLCFENDVPEYGSQEIRYKGLIWEFRRATISGGC